MKQYGQYQKHVMVIEGIVINTILGDSFRYLKKNYPKWEKTGRSSLVCAQIIHLAVKSSRVLMCNIKHDFAVCQLNCEVNQKNARKE